MIYEYECKRCGIMEIQHKISEEKKRCPNCRCKIIRLFSIPHIYIYEEPSSLALQAERNTNKMSKELLDIKRSRYSEKNEQAKEELFGKKGIKHKPKKKRSVDDWCGELPKNKKNEIFSGKPHEIQKKAQKYIEEGV